MQTPQEHTGKLRIQNTATGLYLVAPVIVQWWVAEHSRGGLPVQQDAGAGPTQLPGLELQDQHEANPEVTTPRPPTIEQ